jgi:hypothetical protein
MVASSVLCTDSSDLGSSATSRARRNLCEFTDYVPSMKPERLVLTCLTARLKSLKGEARVKVLDAFLEASAVTIPNLQEIFDYSQEAMEGNSSITLEPVTALRKLIPLIRQDSENSVKLIAGTEILNEEFEHCGRPDDASALLNEFGAQSQTSSNSQKTQSDSGYDYNDHDDDNDDNHDDSNDNDNDGYGSYNNDANKENDEPGTPPAKRQKLGQLPVHTRR